MRVTNDRGSVGIMELRSTGRFTPQLRKLVHYWHDKCQRCGESFPSLTPTYAGYTKDGEEAYVGDCCKGDLGELASYIYWWWDSYKRPRPDTRLMRFMDFSKFMAML